MDEKIPEITLVDARFLVFMLAPPAPDCHPPYALLAERCSGVASFPAVPNPHAHSTSQERIHTPLDEVRRIMNKQFLMGCENCSQSVIQKRRSASQSIQ
eukprot:2282108-Rhodomonas_salina.1